MNLLCEYIRESLKESLAIGQCYPHAVNMAKESQVSDRNDLKKFKVVHGRVTNKFSGESYDHAWVEKGGTVFDWQTRITKPDGVPKEAYDDILRYKRDKEANSKEYKVLYKDGS